MRIKALVSSVLGLALVTLLASTVSAGPIDTGDVEYTVEEQHVDYDNDTGLVAADAEASTGEHQVRVDGPRCYFESGGVTDAADECSGPDAETSLSDPSVGFDFDVPILNQATFTSTEGEYAYGHSTAVYAADGHVAPQLVVGAAIAGASLFAAYGAWRFLKFLAFAGFLPLYSYIPDEKLLDDPNRRAIFTLIKEAPGTSTKDIADRLGLAWGTATHHLNKLEKRRMVVSRKYGKYRRYFANGAVPQNENKEAVAVLRVPQTADVASFIERHPGLSQKEVSERLDVSASTILWHVKRLVRVGLVEKVRDGKRVKYYPTHALRTTTETTAPTPALAAGATPREEAPFFVA